MYIYIYIYIYSNDKRVSGSTEDGADGPPDDEDPPPHGRPESQSAIEPESRKAGVSKEEREREI